MAEDSPKMAQDGPKMPQEASKMVQNCQRRPQDAPGWPQAGPKSRRDGKEWFLDGPQDGPWPSYLRHPRASTVPAGCQQGARWVPARASRMPATGDQPPVSRSSYWRYSGPSRAWQECSIVRRFAIMACIGSSRGSSTSCLFSFWASSELICATVKLSIAILGLY
jgi:hypothetical protein